MNAFRGFIIGAVLGLVCWSAVCLACVYVSALSVQAPCNPDRDAARCGMPIDKR
jgi:hypothetical protein